MSTEEKADLVARAGGSAARRILFEAGFPSTAFLAELDEDAPLIDAGVDSAHLIELALLIEEWLGAPLAAGDLDRLVTLRSIDDLLRDRLGKR